jgi:HD-GYP domain-containing protein (c-di-GMP phosphodiesterase class II)
VLTHQERWDGGGYPLGLKGTAIPLEARLFAVVDTFDAIRSDRPYRQGRSYSVAREIIAAESGRQFDPAVVAAFLTIPESDWAAIAAQVILEKADPTAEDYCFLELSVGDQAK